MLQEHNCTKKFEYNLKINIWSRHNESSYAALSLATSEQFEVCKTIKKATTPLDPKATERVEEATRLYRKKN